MYLKLLRSIFLKHRIRVTPGMAVFSGLLLIFIFLRLYQLEARMPFAWDQIQNSWVMKNLIVNHRFPLEGMVAKGNSGFYIGPAYYYLLAPFYFIFNLDPVAAAVFAGIVAVLNFLILYFVTKRLFSAGISLLALFIYTFSQISLTYDRIPWPVIFIPGVSVLIFYFLYQSLLGKTKYIFWLAFATGFAFNIHFSAIFFPIIILLTTPLLLRQKKARVYGFLSMPLFAVWFLPNILAGTHNGFAPANNIVSYIATYYHGFHLTRFWQITGDAFIQFSGVLYFNWLKILSVMLLPIFMIVLYKERPKPQTKILLYLVVLWFLIPWVIFTVYSGEISDYYFILNRPLVFIILGYLIYRLIHSKFMILKVITILFLAYYAAFNVKAFNDNKYSVLPKVRESVKEDIRIGKMIPFSDGNPEAYLYYVEIHKRQ